MGEQSPMGILVLFKEKEDKNLLKYIGKRILSLIPVLFIVSIVIFIIIHLTPGDPARAILGDQATEQEVENLRESMGLNDSLPVQYVNWVKKALRGNLGTSAFSDETVVDMIKDHLGPTLSITIFALLIAVGVGVPFGVLAAKKHGQLADSSIMVISLAGISIPNFLIGLLLILFFGVKLNVLPVAGYKTMAEGFGQHIRYLVLPSVSLGLMEAALITRMTRASMLEILNSDYIKMAKAKGVKSFSIIFKHAFRNVLVTLSTVVGQTIIALISGAAVVETIFNVPGIGSLIVTAVQRRDYAIIQGITLVIAVFNVLVNLIVDLLYGIIDPRVRLK